MSRDIYFPTSRECTDGEATSTLRDAFQCRIAEIFSPSEAEAITRGETFDMAGKWISPLKLKGGGAAGNSELAAKWQPYHSYNTMTSIAIFLSTPCRIHRFIS